jgi:hypothetical protein
MILLMSNFAKASSDPSKEFLAVMERLPMQKTGLASLAGELAGAVLLSLGLVLGGAFALKTLILDTQKQAQIVQNQAPIKTVLNQ